MVIADWAKTCEEIAERWPKWDRLDTERLDWQRAYGNVDQSLLREALFRVRRRYSSDEPRMKWVDDMLKVVRSERAAAGRPDAKSAKDASWSAQVAQVESDEAKAERLGLPWPPPYIPGQARKHVTDDCDKPCWFCSMGVAQEGVA